MFVTVDEVKYEAVDYVSTTIKVGDVSTYKLKVSAEHQYSTCMLPFDYVLPTDSSLVAYECSEYTSRNLHLDEVDTMLAYTPYIIYSEVGYADTLSGIVDVAKYPVEGYVQKGYLVGVVEQIVIAESNYVMQDKGEGMMFYRVGTTPFVLAAGNCFVSMPEEVKAPSLVIGEDSESSGCMQMKVEDIPVKTYNIYGQCVERMLPDAIYIVDGQKVIVK
jgi:hypothetical protein